MSSETRTTILFNLFIGVFILVVAVVAGISIDDYVDMKIAEATQIIIEGCGYDFE